MSIIVTADSSCDLPKDALSPIPFELIPLTIIQNGVEYLDGVDITPEDIYRRVAQGEPVPTTSAVNVADYHARFSALSHQHDAVIHISLGSGISSCYTHAKLAAEDFPNVYLVDSQNISVGSGLLVLEAKRLIEEGRNPKEIADILTEMAKRVEFTFLIDQLTYLHKGGRCSGIAALGANLLRLKPSIAVHEGGTLGMAKKYRGVMDKVLPQFLQDRLKDRSDIIAEKTLLVTTSCPAHWITLSTDQLQQHTGLTSDILYYAGCTICSHSGPQALGLAVLKQ